MAENVQGYALDWDSEIQNDGQEYLILKEGDYNFEVTSFERKQFPGGTKIPPCKKAEITLKVDSDDGIAICKIDLILYSSMEWKISEFFRCIGQKKKGVAFVPNWSSLIGSTGRAHFKPRTYEKNGESRQVNDISVFYDADEVAPAAITSAPQQKNWAPPAPPPPVQNGSAPTWGGGKF